MSGAGGRVVIVGASAGGLATAEALRRAGHHGVITLVGDEDGPPYDRPPLSKQLLCREWEPDAVVLRSASDLAALGLEWRQGIRAVGLDTARRTVSLADGTGLEYDELVVATGVRPRLLPGADGLPGVHVLRTVADALALRDRLLPGRHLVIVGAGFVGAEVAATARTLGVTVTMLESGPVPLAQAVGTAAGEFLTALHRERGVLLRAGAAVTRLRPTAEGGLRVGLADGTAVLADDVLVAVGSVPNTEWLAGSGLDISDGLVCDEYCAAADAVHGVGDVARWYNPQFGTAMRVEHRTHAAEQGIAVARNLVEPHARRPFAPVPYFWSDQYEVKVQAYGYLRGHDEARVLDADLPHRRLLVAYRKDDRVVGVLAAGISPKTLRAWRAHVLGRASWADLMTSSVA